MGVSVVITLQKSPLCALVHLYLSIHLHFILFRMTSSVNLCSLMNSYFTLTK